MEARRRRYPVAKVKGGWTAEQDDLLCRLVADLGEGNWSLIAKTLNDQMGKSEAEGRIGKQCRERWSHHLHPDLRKEPWTAAEEALFVAAHRERGNCWSAIARDIPGRSENAVKNHWNATLRRKHNSYSAAAGTVVLRTYMQELKLIPSGPLCSNSGLLQQPQQQHTTSSTSMVAEHAIAVAMEQPPSLLLPATSPRGHKRAGAHSQHASASCAADAADSSEAAAPGPGSAATAVAACARPTHDPVHICHTVYRPVAKRLQTAACNVASIHPNGAVPPRFMDALGVGHGCPHPGVGVHACHATSGKTCSNGSNSHGSACAPSAMAEHGMPLLLGKLNVPRGTLGAATGTAFSPAACVPRSPAVASSPANSSTSTCCADDAWHPAPRTGSALASGESKEVHDIAQIMVSMRRCPGSAAMA
mmetsp:Transcript_24486/g.72578  ORF Transcript_24486/g.72578 Transcript_24486/m.72578 type:complete len:419 (-) Transcript_24486:97-1353(-)